jgi:hypothetical protein
VRGQLVADRPSAELLEVLMIFDIGRDCRMAISDCRLQRAVPAGGVLSRRRYGGLLRSLRIKGEARSQESESRRQMDGSLRKSLELF